MELLFEHTLKKQEERKQAELEAIVAEQAAELAALKAQVAAQGPAMVNTQNSHNTINTNSHNTIQNINIFADRPLALNQEMLLKALRSCPSFQRFADLHDDEKFIEENRPLIHGSIMDLTKLSHEAPENRNIYLSKSRSDQVMIMTATEVEGPRWEVLHLDEAVKNMVAGMSKELREIGGNHKIEMAIDDRGALCGLGFTTLAEGEVLAGELKPQMVAHLTNQRPE